MELPLDERYSRQILFAGIGEAGQRRLLASRVVMVGCGAFLARSGVPGFVIWIALLCVWLVQMSVSYWRARRLHLGSWAGLFVFVICYVLASLVNASFDPALEWPTMGIWFWSVVGLGIGASLVFPYGLSSPRTLR